MPSKYSHALVLSHYQSCGLIKFPQGSPPYVAPLRIESSLRNMPKSRKLDTDDLPQVDKSRRTPFEPAVTIKLAPFHRPAPSSITDIYAPERTSSPLQDSSRPNSPVSSLRSPSIFSLDLEFDNEFSSGTNCPAASTSARSSSLMRFTPRSYMSPILESAILGPFEDFPPNQDIYSTVEDYAAKPCVGLKITPAFFHQQSIDSSPHYRPCDLSPSTRSPSPDDAIPPPITLYRRPSSMPVPKQNRTSMSLAKSSQSSQYPDIAPCIGRNSIFDQQRVERSVLSHRNAGSKHWQR